ncbi:uncharacterized protein [Macrobrachium rosenbergii]|uniref:uncharacterized protein isoform X6 n=1 Tax=Macrobrachium rosenbergii TaxID=79674 RepID=UPI0034D3C0EB
MANQQFCLRWNNYQTNLTQVFDQLFQSESFVDVTLACEGHSVKAHRMVLSACSPYFQELLSDAPCSHPVIILQGVKWTELKAVVEFMYKGEINISQDDLGSLLRVAEYLKIRGLAEVDGDPAETAVLTSPSISPAARALANVLNDESPVSSVLAAARKRRRLSGGEEHHSSRPSSPLTPTSAPELFEHMGLDLPGLPTHHIRGGGSAPLPGSPAPFANLPSPHLQGPMPPPQMPPHLPHLPHLPPLSPLLNMHSLPRPHVHDDFEIRPGIAEMIREEERRRRDAPDMAKLLESSHHWMGTSMADGGRPVFPSMFADLSSCGLPHATSAVGSGPGPGPGPGGSVGVQGNAMAKRPQPALSPSSKAGVKSTPTPLGTPSSLWAPPPSAPRRHPNLLVNDLEIECCKDSGKPSTCKTRIKDCERASVPSPNSPASVAAAPPHPPPPPAPPPPPLPSLSSRTGLLEKNFIQTRTSTPPHGPLEGTWENIRGAVSGPKSGPSRWTQNDLMAALTMVKSGTPIKPAAERCNIPVMTLWRRTRALGIVSSKVQCGFRYPAARKRTKPDAENTIMDIKPEPPDMHVHVKSEPRANSYLAPENDNDYMFLNFSRENAAIGCRVTKDRSPLRTVYRERSLEVSPKAPHKNFSRLSSRGEDISKSGRRENSVPPSRGEVESPSEEARPDLIREVNSQSPKWKGESGLRPLRYITSYECSRPMAEEEKSSHISEHSDANTSRKPVVVATEGASRTTLATGTPTVISSSSSSSSSSHPTEGPDRFCAWVDIVLEGAATGCHSQERKKEEGEQIDSPEDLSTHPQHPLSPPQSTSSSTSPSSNTLPYPPS